MAILNLWNPDTSTWFQVPMEDPTLFMRHDGSVAMTDDLDMGGQAITNVGNVDGRNVSADGIVLDAHVADTSDPHGAIMGISTRLETPEIRAIGGDLTLDVFDPTADRIAYVKNSAPTKVADLNVERNIILGGTVDGVDIAGTVVTTDANLTDDALVRGKGGALGAQTSIAILTDAGALSGLTQLDVGYLKMQAASAQITVTFTNSDLILFPNGTGLVRIPVVGTVKAARDVLQLENLAFAADMDGTETSILFKQDDSGGTSRNAARITVVTETDWTPTAGTRDAYMSFRTVLGGNITEHMRLGSDSVATLYGEAHITGPVGINTTDPGGIFGSALLDIRNNARCGLALITYSNTATTESRVFAARARGVEGTEIAVQDDDVLFLFQAIGYDTGGAWRTAAYIKFDVDGAPSAGAVPGAISFWTAPPGGAAALHFTIQSSGNILVGASTVMLFRDLGLAIWSSVDGQLDIAADVECEITAPLIDLNAASIFAATMISGTDQADAGAAAGELYVDTNDDNTVKRGV